MRRHAGPARPSDATRNFPHPWLRIQRVVRSVLERECGARPWMTLKEAAPTMWAERRKIQEAGWFN